MHRCTALVLLIAAACGTSKTEHPADTGAPTTPAAATGTTSATPTGDLGARGFSVTAEQRTRLRLVTVQAAPYQPIVQATGTVAFNGDHSTPVLSPVSGPAVRIFANPGASVRQGDALATVSSPDFAAAVADFRKAESGYRNLKRIADLDEQLFKNDALARRELEQAQTDAAAAAADRDAAIEQLRALGVSNDQIAAVRAGNVTAPLQAIIRAPISGTVVEKLISPGQLLQAGSTQAFTIADLSTMWVMANVFAEDLRDVAVGDTADVTTDAGAAPVRGRVDYVAALVDPASKAVAVRILVPNVGRVLRKDMFVRVAIHSTHQHSGMFVPASAVLRDEDNLPFVFVAAKDSSFNRRRVTLGAQLPDGYQVTGGLTGGEQVVADGALFLQFAETQ